MARRTLAGRTSHRYRWQQLAAVLSGVVVTFASSAVWAQLPSTQLSSVFPPGGKFGTTVDVQVAGADQIDLTALVFSHPGITATQKMAKPNEFLAEQPVAGAFTVQIAGDVPAGSYEARVVGRHGISNPRAFTVGLLDELVDRSANNAPATATELTVDKTVNGLVDANNRDHFKIALNEGQRVLLDCAAQRIDSRIDATLVVYDPQGRELARSRDYLGTDPLIDFTASATGEYRVVLYDFLFRGGADYFYRLTVHMGPHIDFIFPPAGMPGTNDSYTIYGRNLPGGSPSEFKVDGIALEQLSVNIPLPNDEAITRQLAFAGLIPPQSAVLDSFAYRFNTATPYPIQFATAPIVKEIEPNSEPSQAQQVSVPCEIAGQFYPARDQDYFQFEAKKGEVYFIDVISQRMGLDVDPYLIVQRVTKNEAGEETVANLATIDDPGDRNGRIGSNFDTSTDDPSYRLAVDQDGLYRVLVRDQLGAASIDPRKVYRLAIRLARPDFRVIAVAERIQAPVNAAAVLAGTTSLRRGGTTLYDVRIERVDGFSGEVEITAEDLPTGVTCAKSIIGESANSTVLVFKAAEDAPAWHGLIRVVGQSKLNDQPISRYARGGAAVWETGNRVIDPPKFRATQDIAFAVIDKDPEQALVTVADEQIWETSRGGKLEVPVQVTRRGDFKGDLSLVAINVPNEFKPANVDVKGDAAEGKLLLDLKNNAIKPGIYTFYLRADTKIKHALNPDAVTRLTEDQKTVDAAIVELTAKLATTGEASKAAALKAQELAAIAKQATDAKTIADTTATQAAEAARQAAAALAAANEAAAKDAANEALKQAATEAQKTQAAADEKNVEAIAQQKAAEATLTQALADSKQAEEAKVAAEKAAADADATLKRAQAVKVTVDKQLADTTKANAPVDKNVAFLSTPIRLRVLASPLNLQATAPAAPLKQGEKAELNLALERLYGFEEPTDVTLELPQGVAGIAAAKLTIAKDQQAGKVELTANKDATPGTHTLTLRAKAKFNSVDVEATQQVTVQVEKTE